MSQNAAVWDLQVWLSVRGRSGISDEGKFLFEQSCLKSTTFHLAACVILLAFGGATRSSGHIIGDCLRMSSWTLERHAAGFQLLLLNIPQ